MKKYYVAFFPDLNEHQWISKFRSKFDEKSQLVAPHITLFFPAEIESFSEFRGEIARLTSNVKKFEVRFRSAMVMPESSANGLISSVFLVPDEGFANIIRLHDLLYSGLFANLLRLDIAFVPHMTIGSNLSLSDAKAQVDFLNSTNFDFEVQVDHLSIVEIADPAEDRIIQSSIDLK